jgi:predicted YcjX-like family ATPase
MAGATVDVIALAAVRATREAHVRHGGEMLPSIVGVPAAGETAGGKRFDGATEVAVFPGDLPADPDAVFAPGKAGFRGLTSSTAEDSDYRFLRFRPPPLERGGDGPPALPHIRLDRALQFLIGDRLT